MIRTERLVIRALQEKDVELIRKWRNAHKDSFFDSSEISKEQQRAWYVRYQETRGTDQMFIICLKDGTPIGQAAIYGIDVGTRRATFGRFLLLEEYRHHGYAEESVKALMDYAFTTLRLYKVKVEVFIENIDAIAIYARSGFKTTTKPIMLMECVNSGDSYKDPMILSNMEE